MSNYRINNYENFKENVDINNKHGLQDVISRMMCCQAQHLKLIDRTGQNDEEESSEAQPLIAAVLGVNNTSILASPSLPRRPELTNTWTDIDEQHLYLNTKPNCYLILGKPGSGSYSLGEAVAKKMGCIHICARNVLLDEINQKSPTGICLDFNMRHFNEIKIKVLMNIIKQKLQSPAAKHRGYVLSGFPLVDSNRSEICFFKKLHSEESVRVVSEEVNEFVMTFKKKKAKKSKSKSSESVSSAHGEMAEEEEEAPEEEEEQTPEEAEEEEDKAIEFPKFLLEPCKDIIFSVRNYYQLKKEVLVNQINDMLKLEPKPDVIIYMTSTDEDLVTKKNHEYLDYAKNLPFTDPILSTPATGQRWPSKYSLDENIDPYETHRTKHKYCVKQPFNFTKKSVEQMCSYRKHILPFLEAKVKDINPKLIIKVDGRTSVAHMLHHIYEKLHLMPVTKPVHIPEPLYLEEPSEDMEEFWKSMEELSVAKIDNTVFNYYASAWYNRCPVELKKRITVRGKPKYAVTFFKHVYLLSSLDALVAFCRNPRQYLKIDCLEPVCRIIVMGTQSSGKTMISECLSWLFDTPVTAYSTIFEEVKKNKYESFAQTILSEIIATIEDTRFEEWQKLEAERLMELDAWQSKVLASLKKYIIIFSEYKRQKNEQRGPETPAIATLLKNVNNYQKQLSFLPFLDDIEQCKNALSSKDVTEYAPASVSISPEKPAIPVLGDPDVTKAIAAYIETNELQKEIDPNAEDVMNVIIDIIKSIDNDAQEAKSTYGKFIIDGFPPDTEYWNLLTEAKLLPDNTIAILENREVDKELIKKYRKVKTVIKCHKERFTQANDPLVKIKLQQTEDVESDSLGESNLFNMEKIINDFSEDVIEEIFTTSEEDSETVETEERDTFVQTIESFREGWDGVKAILEERFKSFIEVEINEMSDIEIIDEVLHKLRESYYPPCEVLEAEGAEEQEEFEVQKDLLNFNEPRFLCETGIYCPITFFDYCVLWEGKAEFSMKLENKMHYFAKEECLEIFKKDVTKYQSYNKPFKYMPPWRICVMGPIGSGKSSVSKFIAKELGLIYIDYEDAVNNLLMPRHYKKVGRKYENSFTDTSTGEEAVVEFQMDEENENLISDIISNETELRRMISNYFERATPLLSALVQKLLKKFWFEEPFVKTGFVIDGFPKVSNDVEDMAACFCIPDLVIDLECSSEVSVERISPLMMQTWRTQQNNAKEKERIRLMKEKKNWFDFITKQVVAKVVFDDIVDNVMDATKEPEVVINESTVMNADPNAVETDLNVLTTYKDMIELWPAPVSAMEWEKPGDARERINERIEGIFESDDEGIQSVKDIISEQKIRSVSVDASRPFSKLSRKVLSKLTPLRNRCALFEQTFIVTHDVADTLISKGFYFLSKFSRLCPVYIYENPNAILNPYKVGKLNGTVFPIVHRCYIYYVYGKDSVIKFRCNPLEYITCNNIMSFHVYPLRLAVIGPPKSGKSTLAARLAKEFGLKCVSRGKAIRNTLENLHWTKLATKMNAALKEGECINYELIINAVQTVLIDYRTTTHGFVLDGFPDYPPEAMELEAAGIYPLVIFDLSSHKTTILQNAKNEVYYDIIKYMPPFSQSFVEYRALKWSDKSYAVRDFINSDCQNLTTLDGNISKWKCFKDSKDFLNKSIVPKIHFYVVNVKSDLALPVDVMCITNETFNKKCSSCGNLCPVCLRNKILRCSSGHVDKKGLIQYEDLFYWICPEHLDQVLKRPFKHLQSRLREIPEIPAVVKAFDFTMVYENGVCIVTYAENLPAQIIKRGSNKYAANYKKRVYLFCEEKCLKKFLAKPHMYFDITVFKASKGFPQISLKKLPNIGYLEQSVGDMLTEACCAVNVLRPKYPGLNIRVSALLYIALYMKVHNPLADPTTLPLYIEAFNVYEARSKFIIALGLRLRSTDNPFAKYPRCCGARHLDSGTVCKPTSFASSSQILASYNLDQKPDIGDD